MSGEGRPAKEPGKGDGSSDRDPEPGLDLAAAADLDSNAGADLDPDAGTDPDPAAATEADAEPEPRAAAAAALSRARRAARDRGLRPGSPAARRRKSAMPSTFSKAGRDGRDPQLLGEQIDRLLLQRGWNNDVAVGAVIGRWPAIVGPTVAAHVTPVTFEGTVLTVQADSTSWATQTRLLSSSLLSRIEEEAGHGVVTEIVVLGPSAPSWVRGRRRAPGPGPRDTYG